MPDESLKSDLVRIMHMVDAGKQAMDFAKGRTRNDLDIDAMFRRAIVNCLQEIGEAAVQISPTTQLLIPNIPWMQITRMRNRLVHAYFAINLDLVWDVLVTDLSPLIDQLSAFIKANAVQP